MLIQPVSEKMRLEILVEMQIEILNVQSSGLFSDQPFEKRPVMTMEDFVVHSDKHVESHVAVCCSVLQCVAVCCSVLQCVAVCCSPNRISFRIPLTISSLVFSGTGCIRCHNVCGAITVRVHACVGRSILQNRVSFMGLFCKRDL